MLIVEEASKDEPKKMFIVEKKSKNYGEEWAKCYTYFMVQVQVQEEEDWIPHGAQERS